MNEFSLAISWRIRSARWVSCLWPSMRRLNHSSLGVPSSGGGAREVNAVVVDGVSGTAPSPARWWPMWWPSDTCDDGYVVVTGRPKVRDGETGSRRDGSRCLGRDGGEGIIGRDVVGGTICSLDQRLARRDCWLGVTGDWYPRASVLLLAAEGAGHRCSRLEGDGTPGLGTALVGTRRAMSGLLGV